MRNATTLTQLIESLRDSLIAKTLTSQAVAEAIRCLRLLGYKDYDFDSFPTLTETDKFSTAIKASPASLAEALLWKLGKWKAYKSFVRNYAGGHVIASSEVEGGIVFWAFAKHLKNKESPIYDQHAMRALWALSTDFSAADTKRCKALLFDGSEHWKASGTGDDGSCYDIFVARMKAICTQNGINNEELDKLLMPLGQAIKKSAKAKKGTKSTKTDYESFSHLCWPQK